VIQTGFCILISSAPVLTVILLSLRYSFKNEDGAQVWRWASLGVVWVSSPVFTIDVGALAFLECDPEWIAAVHYLVSQLR